MKRGVTLLSMMLVGLVRCGTTTTTDNGAGAEQRSVVCVSNNPLAVIHPTDLSTQSGAVEDAVRANGISASKVGTTSYLSSTGVVELKVKCPLGYAIDSLTEVSCSQCKPITMRSNLNIMGSTMFSVPSTTDVLPMTSSGVPSANQRQADIQAAKLWSRSQKTLEAESFLEGSMEVEFVKDGPVRGRVRSGLVRNSEQTWRMGDVSQLSLRSSDASIPDSKRYAVIQFNSLDFGEAPQGLSIEVTGVGMASDARTQGVSLRLDMRVSGGGDASIELVRKVCPMLVQLPLNVSLTAPTTTPDVDVVRAETKTVYTSNEDVGSIGILADEVGGARNSFPAGMDLGFYATSSDHFEGSIDDINKGVGVSAKDKAVLSVLSGADFDEPCIDVVTEPVAPVLRNFRAEASGDCSGDAAFWSAALDKAGLNTTGLRSLGSAWASKDCRTDAAEYCPAKDAECPHADKRDCETFRSHCYLACTRCNLPADGSRRAGAEATPSSPPRSLAEAPEEYLTDHPDFPRQLSGAADRGSADRRLLSAFTIPSWLYDSQSGSSDWYSQATTCNSAYRPEHDENWGGVIDGSHAQRKDNCPAGCGYHFNNPWCESATAAAFHEDSGCYNPRVSTEQVPSNATRDGKDCPCQSSWSYNGVVYHDCATVPGEGDWCFVDASADGCSSASFGSNWGYCSKSNDYDFNHGHLPDGECVNKPYCRVGLQSEDALSDAATSLDTVTKPYCQDRCKGYPGQPYKYVDYLNLFDLRDKDEAVWNGTCTGQSSAGNACTFISYGLCYDDLSSLLAHRSGTGPARVESDADVRALKSSGALCPNGREGLCGKLSLENPPTGVARPSSMTCERIPLLNPNSAANASAFWLRPSPYTVDGEAALRQSQYEKLGCLAFRECDYELRKGCFTKEGEEVCVARKQKEWACTTVDCVATARSACLQDQASADYILSMYTEASYGEVYDQFTQSNLVKMRHIDDVSVDMIRVRVALESGEVLSWSQVAQNLLACRSGIPSVTPPVDVEEIVRASSTPGQLAELEVASERCMDRVFAYIARKLEEEPVTASELQGVESVREAYGKSGWTRAGGAVASEFCIDKVSSQDSGFAMDIASFDGAGTDAGGCNRGQYRAKILGALDDVLSNLAFQLDTPSVAYNKVVYTKGSSVMLSIPSSSTVCDLSTNELEALKVAVSGCPAAAAQASGGSRRSESSGSSNVTTAVYSVPVVEIRSGCPDGTDDAGGHTGPRCHDAHVSGKYFEDGHVLLASDCEAADVLPGSSTNACTNGMRSDDCSSISSLFVYDYNSETQTWSGYSRKCTPRIATPDAGGSTPLETVTAKDIYDSVEAINAQLQNATCIKSGDAQSRTAIQNFYSELGYCPGS